VSLPDGSTATVRVFSLPLSHVSVAIRDVGMSTDLEAARSASNASLVVNGGFYSTTNEPEGVALTDGRSLSAFSRGLGGGVVAVTRGAARMLDAETFAPRQLAGAGFAIQCRPRLVVDGRANVRTDDGRRADRTALCLRDHGHTLDVVVARTDDPLGGGGPTLYAFARALQARGCTDALNLDGGPSTGAAWVDAGGVHALPPRMPVRHAVTFVLR
jgi:uncharacterized protein YigE (DUF2233 family)